LPLRSVIASRLTQICTLPHCFFHHGKALNFPTRRGSRQWRRLVIPDPARVAGSLLFFELADAFSRAVVLGNHRAKLFQHVVKLGV
jgi:hypothetical protein